MRLQLYIDGIPHEIDSIDPGLLSRWLIEIFGRKQLDEAEVVASASGND